MKPKPAAKLSTKAETTHANPCLSRDNRFKTILVGFSFLSSLDSSKSCTDTVLDTFLQSFLFTGKFKRRVKVFRTVAFLQRKGKGRITF